MVRCLCSRIRKLLFQRRLKARLAAQGSRSLAGLNYVHYDISIGSELRIMLHKQGAFTGVVDGVAGLKMAAT